MKEREAEKKRGITQEEPGIWSVGVKEKKKSGRTQEIDLQLGIGGADGGSRILHFEKVNWDGSID